MEEEPLVTVTQSKADDHSEDGDTNLDRNVSEPFPPPYQIGIRIGNGRSGRDGDDPNRLTEDRIDSRTLRCRYLALRTIINGQSSSSFGNGRCGRDGDDPNRLTEDRIDSRTLRCQYLALRIIINEEQEEMCRADSERLGELINQIDYLYKNVRTLREQVTDAETFLKIAETLLTKLLSYSRNGVTPSDFITCMIHEFRRKMAKNQFLIKWEEIGMLVSPIFNLGYGCSTKLGPMKAELKQTRFVSRKRRRRTNEISLRPEQLDDLGAEAKTDTDETIATIFSILRRERSVRLENLILNKFLFAQTVDNLFALSFLVKDGRAKIAVSPRNAPSANVVQSGEVEYSHFVFRFDFKDWKLMVEAEGLGEERMPHRYQVSIPLSRVDEVPAVWAVAVPTQAVWKAVRTN